MTTRLSRTTREQDGRPGIRRGLIVVHSNEDVDDETISVGGANKNNITINHEGGGGGGAHRIGEERRGDEMRGEERRGAYDAMTVGPVNDKACNRWES